MIVHAVSGPRNISTALMYSFNQRPDFGVIDEPFYGAYLASNQLDHPGKEQTLAIRPTSHQGCIESILQAESMHRHLYLKNMAHHMVDVDWGFLDRTAHIFWILGRETVRNLVFAIQIYVPNFRRSRFRNLIFANSFPQSEI